MSLSVLHAEMELTHRLVSVYIFFCLFTLTAAAAAAAVASNPGLNVAALLASGTQVTPQIAVAAQMAALQAKTLAETGIAVPSYYNPSSVNPMKFAEQEKKRKKLWQGKKDGVRMFDKIQFFACLASVPATVSTIVIF